MSKERARRRAAREAERAREAAARAARQARAARRRELVRLPAALLGRLLPRRVRVARQRGILARRRRARNAGALVLFLLVQLLSWLLLSGWAARVGVLLLSLLLIPVLVTVAFDRRS